MIQEITEIIVESLRKCVGQKTCDRNLEKAPEGYLP